MSTKFRRSLLCKLLVPCPLYVGAVLLTFHFQHDLGAAKLLLPLIFGTSLYLLKIVLETGWFDATALPRERLVCRSITYLCLLCLALAIAVKMYPVAFN